MKETRPNFELKELPKEETKGENEKLNNNF